MQLATSQMNMAFSQEGMPGFGDNEQAFDPSNGLTLPEALERASNIGLPEPVIAFLKRWPSALLAGVQAIIWENFRREVRVPITFAWQPGYDYSITVHDVYDTPETKGGITIVFTSRYPGDEHPLTRTTRIG
jgi:hypothetical protein